MNEETRTAFEAWYIAHAKEQAGLTITPEEMQSLRIDNNYGRDRGYLNGCWKVWQAKEKA